MTLMEENKLLFLLLKSVVTLLIFNFISSNIFARSECGMESVDTVSPISIPVNFKTGQN